MDDAELSRQAWSMLGRLINKRRFQNFNDAIAEELVNKGYAQLADEVLVPTEKAGEMYHTLKRPAFS